MAYPATRWQPQGNPKRVDPHFERNGIAKLLTLFREADWRGAHQRGEPDD